MLGQDEALSDPMRDDFQATGLAHLVAASGQNVMLLCALVFGASALLGMLQFIAPTLQFLIAVAVYGEPFTRAHAIAFAAIWTALALYVSVMVRAPRLPQPPE